MKPDGAGASGLRFLQQDLTLLLDAETLIINVTHAPTAAEVEAELEEAEAEAGIEHDAPAEEGDAAEGEAAEATEAEEA